MVPQSGQLRPVIFRIFRENIAKGESMAVKEVETCEAQERSSNLSLEGLPKDGRGTIQRQSSKAIRTFS